MLDAELVEDPDDHPAEALGVAVARGEQREELVDAEHVARLLCVERKSVYELARRPNDPLPCVRIGGAVRFAVPQVEEWVSGQAPA